VFTRKAYVTNSSSTSFIAWGYIVPNMPPFVKEKTDDLYDLLYEGNSGVRGTPDHTGNILLYVDRSYENTENCGNYTLHLDSISYRVTPESKIALRKFAKELNINLDGLSPGWFFTRGPS